MAKSVFEELSGIKQGATGATGSWTPTPNTGSAFVPLTGGYQDNVNKKSVSTTQPKPGPVYGSTDVNNGAGYQNDILKQSVVNKPTSVAPAGGISVPNSTITSPTKTQAQLDAEARAAGDASLNAGALAAPNAMIGTGVNNDNTGNGNTSGDTGKVRFIDGKQVDEATYQSWLNTQNTNLTSTERNVDNATGKIVDETQSRIKGQEAVFDAAQLGQRNMSAEFVSNLENYRKEFERQNISNRLLGQEQLEKQSAESSAAMDAELAKSGIVNYDTSAMNHDTRMKYNAFQAKSAGIKAQQELLNGNLTTASTIINDYYNNQQQYLRDRANNYNNIMSGASSELGRLDAKEKEFVGLQLANLEGEMANERKKQETIETYKNDKDTMARALKAGLKLTDDPDKMMSYLTSAANEQKIINDLANTYLGSIILPGDTMEQAKAKLKLDPDFVTQFGKNVDIVTNSKNGAIYAYNKVTGKIEPISAGISEEELNSMTVKEKLDALNTLTTKFKQNTEPQLKSLRAYNNILSSFEVMNQAIKDGTPISAAQTGINVAFNKMIDPTSAVMQGEFERMGASQSLISQFTAGWNKIAQGGTLSPEEAAAYVKVADSLADNDVNTLSAEMDRVMTSTYGTGLTPRELFNKEELGYYMKAKYPSNNPTISTTSLLSDYPELTTLYKKFGDAVLAGEKITNQEMLDAMIVYAIDNNIAFNNVDTDTNTGNNTDTRNSVIDSNLYTNKNLMRTDRHYNPAAIMYEGFNKMLSNIGLKEGVDFSKGDSFPMNEGGNVFHTIAFKNPKVGIDATIKLIDKYSFYTDSGKQRWSHTAIPKGEWSKLDYNQKKKVIQKMYSHEGGNQLNNYFN